MNENAPKKSKRTLILSIVAGIVVLAAIVFAAYWYKADRDLKRYIDKHHNVEALQRKAANVAAGY